jgi:hypothetical protein
VGAPIRLPVFAHLGARGRLLPPSWARRNAYRRLQARWVCAFFGQHSLALQRKYATIMSMERGKTCFVLAGKYRGRCGTLLFPYHSTWWVVRLGDDLHTVKIRTKHFCYNRFHLDDPCDFCRQQNPSGSLCSLRTIRERLYGPAEIDCPRCGE